LVVTSALAAPAVATQVASISLSGPVLRVAGGVELLATVDVRCPSGFPDAQAFVSVKQTINSKLVQTNSGAINGPLCTGKTRTLRVVIPVPPAFGANPPASTPAWSANAVYATGRLTYCDPTGVCYSVQHKRALQLQAARPAQESGHFLLPGTSATLSSTITRAAGGAVFLRTSFTCRSSAPAQLGDVRVQFMQISGGRVWTSENQVYYYDPNVCNGKTHYLRIDANAWRSPFVNGPAFVIVSNDYPVPGTPANEETLIWSPVHIRNP
jgi:hypothetical protein